MSRNVVLVTIDSLRADHCSFLDGQQELTPTMNAMAKDGIVFERAVAPGPRTPSSIPTVFSGEYIRAVEPGEESYWQRWRANIRKHMDRHETIAQRFKDRGYSTVGFTVNPWTQDTGFERGFERFFDLNSETLQDYGPTAFKAVDGLLHGNALGSHLKWFNKREWFIRWTDFYQSIHHEIQKASEPYFIWIFLLDTHQPYIAPPEFRVESSAFGMYYATFRELWTNRSTVPQHVDTRLRKAYRDAVRSVDGFFGRLLSDTESSDPVVVVHADHGEAFGEHGTYGHEQALYQENIHVPLLIQNAGIETRVTEPIGLHQLPEMVELASKEVSFDPTEFCSDFVVSRTETADSISVSGRMWKYIQSGSSEELYDLSTDALEKVNEALQLPNATTELRRLADRHHHHQSELQAVANAVEERLRSDNDFMIEPTSGDRIDTQDGEIP